MQINLENYTQDIDQYSAYIKENKPKLELLKKNLSDLQTSMYISLLLLYRIEIIPINTIFNWRMIRMY